ncbi:MAG: hypothetical protein WD403_14400 [Pirellulales bacterium]
MDREIPPSDFVDPVVEHYKQFVDVSLLRENLKLTLEQRLQKLEDFTNFLEELRQAGRKSKRRSRT